MLDKTDGVALYIQIRDTLREQIMTGVLKPGEKLPSEDDLAARFGVSRMTVRRGISDLVDMGMLYRRRGVGTIVSQLHLERDHNRLADFFETARAEGFEPEVRLLGKEVVPAKLAIAEALGLQESEPLIRIQTLRLANGVPITLYEEYVPYKLCPMLLTEDMRNRAAWQVLEEQGFAIKFAVQRLEARLADARTAALLNIEEDAPILFKNRVIYIEDGTPVELIHCHNNGNLYSSKMTLVR
ncbi:MAG TPA: GntR family transcriptional regulator [Aggregatilineales bacterium]|nr:GntR family transcriptional regulator [Aggregatilineales bacterium]